MSTTIIASRTDLETWFYDVRFDVTELCTLSEIDRMVTHMIDHGPEMGADWSAYLATALRTDEEMRPHYDPIMTRDCFGDDDDDEEDDGLTYDEHASFETVVAAIEALGETSHVYATGPYVRCRREENCRPLLVCSAVSSRVAQLAVEACDRE